MMPPHVLPMRGEGNAVRASASTKCAQCETAFDERAWSGLALVEVLGTERVREHLTSWPSGARIEVRVCSCGREIARKVT
jgi:hypothetical protein